MPESIESWYFEKEKLMAPARAELLCNYCEICKIQNSPKIIKAKVSKLIFLARKTFLVENIV
jgi:hypothetical protein